MCGRITQHRSKITYLREMGWDVDDFGRTTNGRVPNWNVPPGSAPWLIYRGTDCSTQIDPVNWGYRPSWAAERSLPIAINARIEKALTGAFFRPLWKAGRAIVPADGWYEWVGEKGHKQPWYIRQKSDRPMFLAALSSYRPDREPSEGTGFAIVTAAAASGLVDVHGRRPVVFTPADAVLWLDSALLPEQAEQLARTMSLPSEAFDRYKVSTDVNKVGKNDAHLIEPI